MNATAAQPRTAAVAAPQTGSFLRLALKADALITGANGVAYLVAASLLDEPLGVSAAVLRPVGAFLVLFAALVAYVATRETIHPNAVRAIVEANVVWAIASVGVLVAGVLSPSTLGAVWTVMQAGVVAGFAAAQHVGLRRA